MNCSLNFIDYVLFRKPVDAHPSLGCLMDDTKVTNRIVYNVGTHQMGLCFTNKLNMISDALECVDKSGVARLHYISFVDVLNLRNYQERRIGLVEDTSSLLTTSSFSVLCKTFKKKALYDTIYVATLGKRDLCTPYLLISERCFMNDGKSTSDKVRFSHH